MTDIKCLDPRNFISGVDPEHYVLALFIWSDPDPYIEQKKWEILVYSVLDFIITFAVNVSWKEKLKAKIPRKHIFYIFKANDEKRRIRSRVLIRIRN